MPKDIKKYSFKEGLPQEIELIDMGKFFNHNLETLSTPHRAGFYHICWFEKGSPTHLVDFTSVNIRNNSLLFLNKNTVHAFDKKGGFEGTMILFTDNFFGRSELDIKFLNSTQLFNNVYSTSQIPVSEKEDFKKIFHQLSIEINKPKDAYQPDILRNLLHNLLLHAERELQTQPFYQRKKGADLDYVIRFKELLENNFVEQKLVSGYAKEMGLTIKRLNQATSKILEKTPKEIIDDRIILEIKRLLTHTNQSIKEIGFSLGFEEPTNFIKFFKKHQSLTPAEFRTNISV